MPVYDLGRCPSSACTRALEERTLTPGMITGQREGHFHQDAAQIHSIHHFLYKLSNVLVCADVSAVPHCHPADKCSNYAADISAMCKCEIFNIKTEIRLLLKLQF